MSFVFKVNRFSCFNSFKVLQFCNRFLTVFFFVPAKITWTCPIFSAMSLHVRMLLLLQRHFIGCYSECSKIKYPLIKHIRTPFIIEDWSEGERPSLFSLGCQTCSILLTVVVKNSSHLFHVAAWRDSFWLAIRDSISECVTVFHCVHLVSSFLPFNSSVCMPFYTSTNYCSVKSFRIANKEVPGTSLKYGVGLPSHVTHGNYRKIPVVLLDITSKDTQRL